MASERQARSPVSPWWGEHVHRYMEAVASMEPGVRVLDLACGSGFGAEILAQNTEGLVVGGDLALDAVSDSRRHLSRPNLAFAVMDGTRLPFRAGSFDVVVSFETLEHTTLFREMLAEFRRVLRPGGCAFVSTPNFPISSPDGVIRNPFHTQEFTIDELTEILEEAFSQVTVYGQRYSRYDALRGIRGLGRFIERALYMRGVRKLPLGVQDALLRLFTGTPMYPTAADYTLVSNRDEALACKCLFAVCRAS